MKTVVGLPKLRGGIKQSKVVTEWETGADLPSKPYGHSRLIGGDNCWCQDAGTKTQGWGRGKLK